MWLKRIRREKELEQNLGEVTVHAGFRCDGCDVEPIVGSRFQGWAIDIDILILYFMKPPLSEEKDWI